MNPPAPLCIARAIRSCGYRYDHDQALLAQAVWDALLAEGHVCTDWGQYAHYWRRTGALVLPLSGLGDDPHTGAS